MAAMQALAQNR